MTRTTPELAPSLQNSTPHQREDVWALRMIQRATGPIHGGSSVEPSGPKAETLPLGHRGLPLWLSVALSKQGGYQLLDGSLREMTNCSCHFKTDPDVFCKV
ncbi:hypothetical protein AVEN_253457-1 [Araneus ventricosus]|uniref:Uncharacterized protein n=1 Tax=Araneus ventricosus TaxID=182803 RepID=A0A4Y2X235_ARAVE|nr:hypothetical protein AVEN_246279-1 [Araneus ventricosus]GBO43583.1 hypothetical protein AVEN_253457-1 [Araneus ventricosus]